jgi:hypothetical protein
MNVYAYTIKKITKKKKKKERKKNKRNEEPFWSPRKPKAPPHWPAEFIVRLTVSTSTIPPSVSTKKKKNIFDRCPY